ncbi:MAG: UDP-forming cellulose synthase catalytic subunit [Pseudomonadota bacterium]|nr:UDP-forming cellulose synthase catalytic subunit [Pseudomonadota bacterium]
MNRVSDTLSTGMVRLSALGLWVLAGIALVVVAVVPMELKQQLLFSALIFAFGLILGRRESRLSALIMMGLSLAISTRYIWWRMTETVGTSAILDLVLGVGLLLAELYAFVILILSYFQSSWPLNRKPVPMPEDQSQWPSVDVFIPTYNEPLEVVRATVLAATVIDWPSDKLNIYLLDDGRRDEFREFCDEVGIGYLTRGDNKHAKAGNINAALGKTDGEYVAFFDCDHMPTRSFLQVAMGWFLRDPKLALVQLPHYFYSADPFERNLEIFHRVPNEGELFYGLLQDGNDQWDATFFCGSCAVIKREPLEQVGGVAVETVTEDAHTALKMHRLGWRSAYIKIPQAAGLATESLSGHVAQRIRWARGMAQIFRVDNPLFGKGLSLPQRLCYATAMLHFFNGLPRIVFLTAPLAYLLGGIHIIEASALMIMAYALPHIFQANLTNARTQNPHRHLLWNEVYETTLAWYTFRPTMVALFNPKAGTFNVTAKGGLIERDYFDFNIAKPFVFLFLPNLIGLIVGGFKLFGADGEGQAATLLLNMAWTVYNLILLSVAMATAAEIRQVRKSHRVPMSAPVNLYLPDGHMVAARTRDFSTGGISVESEEPIDVKLGDKVELGLIHRGIERRVPATIRRAGARDLSMEFDELTTEQEQWVIATTFARADVWISEFGKNSAPNTLWQAVKEIMSASRQGVAHLFRYAFSGGKRRQKAAASQA